MYIDTILIIFTEKFIFVNVYNTSLKNWLYSVETKVFSKAKELADIFMIIHNLHNLINFSLSDKEV